MKPSAYNNILKNGDVLSDCFRCFVVGIGLAPLIGARPYSKKHVLSVLCNEVKGEQNILSSNSKCLFGAYLFLSCCNPCHKSTLCAYHFDFNEVSELSRGNLTYDPLIWLKVTSHTVQG